MPAAPPLCMSGAGEGGGSCSCRGGGGGGGRERRPLERCVRAVRAHVWVGGGGRSRGGRALAAERRGIVQGAQGLGVTSLPAGGAGRGERGGSSVQCGGGARGLVMGEGGPRYPSPACARLGARGVGRQRRPVLFPKCFLDGYLRLAKKKK